ncbi:MAG: hypothetical protein R3D83_02045 [Caenibius sp.]
MIRPALRSAWNMVEKGGSPLSKSGRDWLERMPLITGLPDGIDTFLDASGWAGSVIEPLYQR